MLCSMHTFLLLNGFLRFCLVLELWPPFSFIGKLSFIIRRFFLRLEIILQVMNERRLPLDESFENFHHLSKVAAFHSNFSFQLKTMRIGLLYEVLYC